MKTVLKCSIPVHRIAVFAEMAWLERRPELGLLCRAALERERYITREIVQSALPGLSETGADNIVKWCEMLGLCDSSGLLTEKGDATAASSEAPVPEQGVYELSIVKHPLLGSRVLHAERLTSARDPRWDAIAPIPVVPDLKRTFVSSVNPQERFIVRDLPANHHEKRCIMRPSNAECRISWTLDFDQDREQWRLEGSIGVSNGKAVQRKPIVHTLEPGGVDLRALAAEWGEGPLSEFGVWRQRERHLEIELRMLSSEEIESFRKTFSFESIEVAGKGSFDDVRLEAVPIAPRSKVEAQAWAVTRLNNCISRQQRYRSRRNVRSDFIKLIEGTPLSRHAPSLPSQSDLLQKSEGRPAQYWSLAAPVDLSPEPPNAVELGSVVVGAGDSAPAAVAGGEFELRPSDKLSMRQVVERLVGSAAPARVLVCDRHVKGADNMDSLNRLAEALRAVAQEVVIDVWTIAEPEDIKRIQSIVRTKPRDLRDVFSGRPPHDRYFLVSGGNGESIAWRMTHTLLHGRPLSSVENLDSPLKWNDLLATKRDPEQLEPLLRTWLKGGSR
jgi:hypothetical protein